MTLTRRYAVAAAALLSLLMPIIAGDAAHAADSRAVVIMYHRFGEDSIPATNIRIDQFRSHVAELTSGGYTVLPLPEVVDAIAAGQPLPDRSLAITVDDAFSSVFESGWPILREANLPFTLFVATDQVGKPGYMTWDQIRTLRDAGVVIGAHHHAHGHMPEMSPQQQAAEMNRSLEIFEQELGARPALFAYPYGEADAAAIELARASGFRAGFGQHSGPLVAGENMFYLPRFALNESYGSPERFRMVANALPIAASDVVPVDPTLSTDDNPPLYGFTVTDQALKLDRLACYGPGGDPVQVEVLGPRVEVRLNAALSIGRNRINCTLPGPTMADGSLRWHWRGTQFVVTGAAGTASN